jgi:hypothetical protein
MFPEVHMAEESGRTGPVGWLLDDLGCGLSLLWALVFGGGAVFAASRGYTPVAVLLATIAAPGALVVVVRLAGEALAELAGYLVLALCVLLFPLLAIPAVRRWIRRR